VHESWGQNHIGLALELDSGTEVLRARLRQHKEAVWSGVAHGSDRLRWLCDKEGGCRAGKHHYAGTLQQDLSGSSDAVCWSVKRALLSQGYMLDRPGESGVLTGTRDFQPEPKLNVSYHLQTTCADNRDGTSIVLVTAEREESQLQKMKQSTSVGIGPATLTMPSGSAQVLGVVRRETVKDRAFYDRFFSLV